MNSNRNSFDWINLTRRHGQVIIDPSKDDLNAALQELFDTVDNEHPDAWVECGLNGGEVFVLIISQNKDARYFKYSDADMNDETEYKNEIFNDQNEALNLWVEFIGYSK